MTNCGCIPSSLTGEVGSTAMALPHLSPSAPTKADNQSRKHMCEAQLYSGAARCRALRAAAQMHVEPITR